MDERETIFRRVVVERLSSPDQLDQLLQVLRPRSWMLLAAIGLLFASAFAWSVSGTVAVTVPASGLLLRPGGIADLAASHEGHVVALPSVGDELSAGETAVTLERTAPAADGEGARVEVRVPIAARVVEVLTAPGRRVEPGTPLVSFESATGELRAVLFVGSETAPDVRPGLTVWISTPGAGGGAAHRLPGEVIAVATHPATTRGLEALLSDADLAARLMAEDRRWRVDVRLPEGPPAGDRATTRVSRTAVHGQIVLREVRPLRQFLPWGDLEGG